MQLTRFRIMFMQEYSVLDSAASAEQLRLRLKPEDYEKYGESFIPEFVYGALQQLSRFREMRRGHQQDAQEFLGFLLEELHEECTRSMKSGGSSASGRSTPLGSVGATGDESGEADSGWMEVGHKQRPAVTRSSGGAANESPINNIFGGKLRSELKVAGNKLSVTLEPYSPLQLDIGSPEVSNIIDALKGLTRPESMQGDFQSARGQRTSATKQVFIETLPPVLILHLKRFQYDSTTKRAEKIWKKVGYPLELEIPREVFPVTARNKFAAHGGLPRYRLTGVIYHHGKNANGGHYTVDIRRQDGKEWIRIDDTLIRRIRSDDVAEGGSEEDPKVLAAALERHKQGSGGGNRFEQIEQEEEDSEPEHKAWSQVNGHSRSKSTMSAVVNGSATPAKSSGPQTPREKYAVKDNKVAYLLFYQRMPA
jgi:ubiquitin carboxyl-terminal hydrolase 10